MFPQRIALAEQSISIGPGGFPMQTRCVSACVAEVMSEQAAELF